MVVSLSEKRYQLREIGNEVTIHLWLANEGPGVARNVSLEVTSDHLNFAEPRRVFANFHAQKLLLQFVGTTRLAITADTMDIIVDVSWDGSDGRRVSETAMLAAPLQAREIDWDQLEFPLLTDCCPSKHPEISLADASSSSGSSASSRDVLAPVFIRGQRRVGKTSIVVALLRYIADSGNSSVVPLRLGAGRFTSAEPRDVPARLGHEICEAYDSPERSRMTSPFQSSPIRSRPCTTSQGGAWLAIRTFDWS